ncbi:helix-turn-helix domain-containing protein [Salmonella enterica]|nr:hypothetical protein [Salmonella enterica]EFT5158299.1 helix-turn-helix domain-containing protein [Salmonella enterica]EHS0545410.1 helix-turn-helix domain-containing protein [Salmonella enterica]EHS7241987.1 helix-turn-helix domain-containing protein [Salmonella enterica]EIF6812303.1 helix-turn-helix domain-containing protein [Salmonella enterica]
MNKLDIACCSPFISALQAAAETYLRYSFPKLFYILPNSTPGVVYSADDISIACWPGRVVSASSVPVAVKRVRDFLKKAQLKSRIITHKGVGYSFLMDDNIEIIFRDIELVKNDNLVQKDTISTSKYNYLIRVFIAFFVCFFVWLFFFTLEWDDISVQNGADNKQIISSTDNDKVDVNSLKSGECLFIDQSNYSVVCTDEGCFVP